MSETVQALVAQAPGGGGIMQIVLFMVPMFAILYFLMIRPERKKQADAQALLQSLKKGDEVALTSGIIGEILAVDDKTVTVEIADKTKVRVLKQAVMGPAARYLQPTPDPKRIAADEKAAAAAAAAGSPSGNPTPVPDKRGDKDKSDKKSA